MKTITIFLLLFITNVYSQTLSDSVKQLWNDYYGVADTTTIRPVLRDSILTYPSPNVSIISQLYSNPNITAPNTYKIFYLWNQSGVVSRLSFESNYLKYWNYTNLKSVFGTGAESIFYWNGFYYGSLHSWSGNVCSQIIRKSTDNGMNFFNIGSSMVLGEDIFFDTFRSDSVWCYARTLGNVFPRDISLIKSKNLINWTAKKLILTPDSDDKSKSLEFYVMCVFHISGDNGTYGLLTILNTITNDVYIQLVYSADGETNWLRCKNKKTFLPIPNGIHQQYSVPVVYNDTLRCITSMSKTIHGSPNDRFGIYNFQIATKDLLIWKQ